MGMESAKTWKPTLPEKTISLQEAESKLKKGFEVKDVFDSSVKFSDETIHWQINNKEKIEGDKIGRLIRLPLAEECIAHSKEIWELSNGFRNYILNYINKKGEHKGIAVSVKSNGETHTYFVQSQKSLDGFRKGKCIYRK